MIVLAVIISECTTARIIARIAICMTYDYEYFPAVAIGL